MNTKQKNNLITSNGAAVTEIEYQKWLAKKDEECQAWAQASDAGTLKDAENPLFLFSSTDVNLLLKVANGQVCPTFMAKRELANRGLDLQGKWVGFDQAHVIHFGSK